jgi:hypothetical protein
MKSLPAFLSGFVLCASMASAKPDCAGPEDMQAHASVASETLPEIDDPSVQNSATAAARQDLSASPRPQLRPCRFRDIEAQRARLRQRGAVCGDWTIIGEYRKPFSGKRPGCGIAEPVRIRSVSDVLLSQLALMDCETAVRLKTWVETSAKPAFADQGGGLKGLRLVGHYACKTRNNQRGGRLSEHARGRAIDVSSFILNDGTVITVRDGWQSPETGAVLRDVHAGACGVFGTVLGPDADPFHAGHFHFDSGRNRSRPYCR